MDPGLAPTPDDAKRANSDISDPGAGIDRVLGLTGDYRFDSRLKCATATKYSLTSVVPSEATHCR